MSVSCNYYFFECTLKDPLTARNGDVSSSKVRTGPAVIGFLAVAVAIFFVFGFIMAKLITKVKKKSLICEQP